MFERIIVAVDGSETARRALDAALDIASHVDASLRVIYVIADPTIYWDAPGYDPSILHNALAEEGEKLRGESIELFRKRDVRGDMKVIDKDALDDVATSIVEAACEFHAHLLVLGTHGRRGVRRLLLGSVAEHCARLAALPVLLIPGREPIHDQAIATQAAHLPSDIPAVLAPAIAGGQAEKNHPIHDDFSLRT